MTTRRPAREAATVFGDSPPRWLRWANTSGARATTTVIAIVALLLSGWLLLRLQSYVDCVAEQQHADAKRTTAIAEATDRERAADRALIAGPVPGGPDAATLRAEAIDARQATDRVRADNPPPPLNRC